MRIEITEVSPEQRRQGIMMYQKLIRVSPAPGSITYSEEGKAQIYNNDGGCYCKFERNT